MSNAKCLQEMIFFSLLLHFSSAYLFWKTEKSKHLATNWPADLKPNSSSDVRADEWHDVMHFMEKIDIPYSAKTLTRVRLSLRVYTSGLKSQRRNSFSKESFGNCKIFGGLFAWTSKKFRLVESGRKYKNGQPPTCFFLFFLFPVVQGNYDRPNRNRLRRLHA